LSLVKLQLPLRLMVPLGASQAANGKANDGPDLEEAQWKEVMEMLNHGGKADRGTHYALTYANLKRKLEDLQKQKKTCIASQVSLKQAAMDESSKQARTETDEDLRWGLNLAKAVGEQATEKMRQALSKKSPSEATTMAQDAQAQVIQAMDAQGQNVEAITVMGAAGAGFAKSKAAQPPTGFGMVAKAPSRATAPPSGIGIPVGPLSAVFLRSPGPLQSLTSGGEFNRSMDNVTLPNGLQR
jgi:hypothetical protein